MTVAAWLRRNAHWHGERTALVSGGRRLGYGELNARANRQVHALQALGLAKGDRVAVLLNNGIEAVEATAAAAKGGFVHVPINVRLSAREVGQILRHSGARVLLVDEEYAGKLDQAGDHPDLVRVVRVDLGDPNSDYEVWLEAESEVEPDVDIVGDDDFLITYTSGTTGKAKGALYQQRQSTIHAPIVVHHYEIEAESRLLLVFPHNSVASFNMFYIPAWMVGATVVLDDARSFSAERWLALIQDEKISHCHLVPTMLFRVLECERLGDFDLSSLRTIGYGSAPMPRERVERLSEVFGEILLQGYGMTEVSSIATILTKADHVAALAGDGSRLAACGRPVFASEIRVVDDDGLDVAVGELGEIAFRGPLLTSGYWGEPELTAETIRDGWLHSGDLGRFDEAGYLYIVDRKKDIIISGGANIAGREVEEVLYWHPAVAEAVVVGRPDPEWGERVHAFVIPLDGTEVDAAELIAFCRERLAHFKCPDRVSFEKALPRNALGKFMKTELRARLRNEAAGGGT